ncbi:precorrin-4 C(11)-methyltransferase, partial [Pararhodospirillum oryzae]|uniref:precorrin-4 C(11)-methyltransferase n=1 Tax=Pararhodospirillum oryzae TaxID=478448 RepID=UPI0011BD5F6E
MTVHFIGAGPGAPDLLTLRAQRLIRACPVLLYAGSLIPREVIAEAPADARIVDTTSLTLDQIIDLLAEAHAQGHDVARLHSGDPSVYSAMAEQIRRLQARGIPYDICPGVPSFAAAAALLGQELTLPEVAQTVILTRTAQCSTALPPRESLEILGQSGATLVLHLSIGNMTHVVDTLTPLYGAECPVAVVFRATWPDELVLRGTLSDIQAKVEAAGLIRTALILVGPSLALPCFAESHLYAADRERAPAPPPGR